ncbi:hypothetical protein [Actinoplanes sp. NPDC051411]|uniref:hypothetical protein n=1 Tax=Actinoplanes sp. NPDC051411 TaxID=3155522 RepID=UPI00342B3822
MSKAARPTDSRGPATPAQPAPATAAEPAAASAAGPPAAAAAAESAAAVPAAASAAAAAAGSAAGPAAAGSAEPGGNAEPGGKAEPWGGWEPIVRAGGVVVSIVFAFVSAVLELLFSTLRAGDFVSIWHGDPIGSGHGPLIPLAVVLAVAGNIGIAWFAVGTTGRRWALGPPWALWTIVMLIAAGVRTHEGDYLLSGTNYVALAMILIGSLTFAIYAYRMILKRIPPAVSTSAAPKTAAARAKKHN